ncbi:unnamed protein product [Schistosoma curassoni]|uniref:Uncharacterized protein n=1 Tax=Schistosoma curassoni TaxID=6186 RepID=A0A183KV45_9TREM|nr:unnamed protein product [Schistosoma curassoni]
MIYLRKIKLLTRTWLCSSRYKSFFHLMIFTDYNYFNKISSILFSSKLNIRNLVVMMTITRGSTRKSR